jgi:hypothetical protein
MRSLWPVVLILLCVQSEVFARGYGGKEEFSMISNGQGIAAPSFHGALFGQNPAGLVQNQRLKIQGNAASFDDTFTRLKPSGGVLTGNGSMAAGVGYSQWDAGAIHWGAAGTLHSASTTFGLAGKSISGSGSTYDFGMFFDFIPRTRIGLLAKDVGQGLHLFGAGVQFLVDSMVDLVVDVDYENRLKQGVVKPGFTLHTDRVHLAVAYGYRYAGSGDSYLTSRLSAGLGLRLFDSAMLQYQYRTLAEHLVGLTLRLN